MEFGAIAVSEAVGAILAHSVKLVSGMLKKGRRLSAEDIAALEASGVQHVFAARIGRDDVAEDEAAAAVAGAVGGGGTRAQAPFTGRANLYAEAQGVAMIDAARVKALNRLHESLTLATVPPFAVVEGREMVATVKVIPFAVPRSVLARALEIIGGDALVRVAPFRPKPVGLVISQLPQTKPSIIEKSKQAMAERLAALGSRVAHVVVADHSIEAVTAAIADQHEKGANPILVFGASAIVDRGDIIPSALVAAGGEVVHLGMPVDPGNLMMFGRLGGVAVIGVPSCARSPKLNGFDWVLQRVMADVPVSRDDIMDMGAGGLLAEIPTRPLPREGKPKVQKAPHVAAIVLAAGKSSRMGANKLLMDVGGETMIRRTVAAAVKAVAEVIVVTGRDGNEVADQLHVLPVRMVHNADFAEGLSTSLKCGLAAVPEQAGAVVVCLGDMPLVQSGVIDKLIAAFNPSEHRSICIATYRGARGNPVLWGRQHFDALQRLTGDTGARTLFDQHADDIVEVEMDDAAVLTDVDTLEALQRVRKQQT